MGLCWLEWVADWGRLWADEPSGGSKSHCPEGIHAGFQWLLSCLFVCHAVVGSS